MADQGRERAERRAALAALLTAAVMIAQQVGSKATRDALFLSSFEPEDLPRVVIAAAAASMVAVFAATRAYATLGPARVVPAAFGVSGALYVAEWYAADTWARPVAVVLYLHTAIFGALVISGFWSVVNERFDPHTAKRVIGRIGTGATLGGVAGGLLAERVGAIFDANAMLLALGLLNVIAAVGITQMTPERRPAPMPESTMNALSILRRAPYLRALAGLVLLTAVTAQLLDYAFKAEAAAHFEQGSEDLLSFFALFHVAAAVLSLVLQFGLARRALERLGVAGSAACLPAVVLVTALVSAGITQLATVVVARASELVMANSIFRNGYELLYTPIAPAKKRPTKALIDVAVNRLGDALGSGVVLIAIAVVPALLLNSIVLGLAAVSAMATLVIARRLHRGYVSQLEESLRSGSPDGAEAALLHAATLQTLSTFGLDREALFEQLSAHQSWSDRLSYGSVDGSASFTEPPPPPDGIDAPDDDPVHRAARTLREGGAEEIRGELSKRPFDHRLAPFAIALLARRDVYQDAVGALRTVVDEVVDDLAPALVDPDQPFTIRRRLPRILAVSDREAAARGLARGLHDDRFEVRYRCALALARIRARGAGWLPALEEIHERVTYELDFGRKAWDSRRLLDEDADDADHLIQKADREKVHKSVEHVFTLLSLAYEPGPVRLSLLAYAGDDHTLRGTALEYLETVLPEEIRDALFPMLDVRVEIGKKRDREEIVADLVRSMQAMDAGALRDAIAAEVDET